jgi:hypothetical protein
MISTAVLLLLASLPYSSPATLPGLISGRVTLPAPTPLKDGSVPLTAGARAAAALGSPLSGQDTVARVVLDGGERETFSSAVDGSFSFEGVPPGQHTLEVFHRDLLFPTYRVDMPGAAGGEPSAGKFPYPGAYKLDARLPLDIAPVALPLHFEERPPSSLWGLARSPMIWMGGAMLVLMFMMKGVDPEEMKCVGQCRAGHLGAQLAPHTHTHSATTTFSHSFTPPLAPLAPLFFVHTSGSSRTTSPRTLAHSAM